MSGIGPAFWPAVVGALGAIIASYVGLSNKRKIAEVHVLVNSRLSTALEEIAELKSSLRYEKTQPPKDEAEAIK
jgi:hypothetical protein